jgi:hypothetical protein
MSFAVRVPDQRDALFCALTDTVYSHLARRFLDVIVVGAPCLCRAAVRRQLVP